MSERADADSPAFDADEMFALAYRELRQLARARLRAGGRNTLLDTTALVHESYMRLSQNAAARFPDRARFLSYAGRAMRSIVVDFARKRLAERRGGEAEHVPFTTQLSNGEQASDEEVLQMHEALDALAKVDARMAQVVELRWFAGLTDAEVAEALGVTDRTVRRDWTQARLFLAEALKR